MGRIMTNPFLWQLKVPETEWRHASDNWRVSQLNNRQDTRRQQTYSTQSSRSSAGGSPISTGVTPKPIPLGNHPFINTVGTGGVKVLKA